MARAQNRTNAAAPRRPRTNQRAPQSELLQTAENMVSQIEDLVAELSALREDNEAMRGELRNAVELLERAGAALGGATTGRTTRRRGRPPRDDAQQDAPVRRGRGRVAAAAPRRGRQTPSGVTPDVVMAVIRKLGGGTSSEIAAEITKLGSPVSGRAIRWIAERAGARVDEIDGQRIYRAP